jgi:hypothetical protein
MKRHRLHTIYLAGGNLIALVSFALDRMSGKQADPTDQAEADALAWLLSHPESGVTTKDLHFTALDVLARDLDVTEQMLVQSKLPFCLSPSKEDPYSLGDLLDSIRAQKGASSRRMMKKLVASAAASIDQFGSLDESDTSEPHGTGTGSSETTEKETANWELMMGTTPAPAPSLREIGCESTALLIAEGRRQTPKPATPPAPAPAGATPPAPTAPTPTLRQEQKLEPEPPPSHPKRNRAGSWAAPLSVLGCIIAAGICGSSKDNEACVFWIFIAIPLVLIYFKGEREAERERADRDSRRGQRGEGLTPEERRVLLDSLDPDSWQARAIARGETTAEAQFGGPVAPKRGDGPSPEEVAAVRARAGLR